MTLITQFVLLASLALSPHGDLHKRIARLTLQIKANPRSPTLHLQRAELHRLHHDLSASLKDCSQALQLDASSAPAHLLRARVLQQLKRFKSARTDLDLFLKRVPGHVAARRLSASNHTALNQHAESVKDWQRVIQETRRPLPSDFIHRARALAHPGLGKIGCALRGLEEGMAKLGPAMSLQLCALDLEEESGRLKAALIRLGRVMKNSQRQEGWFLRKARLLHALGLINASREAAKSGLDSIEELPLRLRRKSSTQDLKRQLNTYFGNSEKAGDS